ncbi:hypothetical protein V5O48_011818 [Marasmius crinis-equi]|uniref:F-box domain-containing protein n=1 Tax=Marasmius crinis-equi TaxID=585013 RepID=A0ABR3F4H7_9AGAR
MVGINDSHEPDGDIEGNVKLNIQNSNNSTCRIPVEVLTSIFQLLVPSGSLVSPHRGSSAWWRFTHVCRQWRNIALSTPLLWTAPDFERPLLAAEMLERSRDVPLHVLIMKWREEEKNPDCLITKTLKEHISRVSTLEMYAGPRTGFSFDPLTKIDTPVPSLHSIHLACILPYMFPGSAPFEFALPEPLLNACSLTSLTIKGFLLSSYEFTTEALTNLTSLHLSLFTEESNVLRPGLQELLSITQRTSNLESLSLEILRGSTSFSPGVVIPTASRSDEPIPLPHLRSVRLQGNLDCVHFLDYWTFPTSAGVEVIGKFIPPACSHSIDADFAPLSRLIPSSSMMSILIEGDYRAWSHRTFWVTGVSVHYNDASATVVSRTPPLKLALDIEHSEPVLRRLLRALPLSQLASLHFACTSSVPEPVYTNLMQDCFGSLPKVRRVSIQGSDVRFAKSVLAEVCTSERKESIAESIAFPGLRTLEFGCGQDDEELVDGLLETVSLRKRADAPLETLQLWGDIDEASISRLKEVVGRVVVS